MPDRILPGGLALRGFWDLGDDTWKSGVDTNWLKLSALCQLVVLDVVNATPGAPVNGDVYAFGDTHPTNADSIAIRDNGAWTYIPMFEGLLLFDSTANAFKWFSGTTLIVLGGGGGSIPTGGTTGQVLAKLSNTDLDAGWVTPGGGSSGREIIGFATTAPTANEVLTEAPSARAWVMPANLAGTIVTVGTNPAATFVLSVKRNNIEVATISVSTGGVATLATSGGTLKNFAIGDLLSVHAPAAVDAAITRLTYSILGTV